MRTPRLLSATFLGMLAAAGLSCDPGPSDLAAEAESSTVQERSGVKIGGPAPDFQLWTLEGQPVSLSSYQGRVVLLNFWATWCGPCRIEMPAMEQLYHQFPRKDFEILAVSTDAQGAAVTRPFRDDMRLSFPILHDSDFRVGLQYGTRTLPMTFLINRRGIITHRIYGARDWYSTQAIQMVERLIRTP